MWWRATQPWHGVLVDIADADREMDRRLVVCGAAQSDHRTTCDVVALLDSDRVQPAVRRANRSAVVHRDGEPARNRAGKRHAAGPRGSNHRAEGCGEVDAPVAAVLADWRE